MLGNLGCLGYIHENVAMFGKTHIDNKVDPLIRDVMQEYHMFEEFDDSAFQRIRSTHFGANKGILKYSGPLGPPAFPMEQLSEARWLMYRMYAPYERTCEVISEDEVTLKLDSHCGYEYRSLGFKNKGEVLKNPHAKKEVEESWYYPDHPSIFKCSFKDGELLKKKKVESNDGRVFIVADIKFLYAQTRLFHNVHELLVKLSQDPKFPLKIGFCFQHGGFSRLMEILRSFNFIVEGDVSKWDSSMWEFVTFFVIYPLLTRLFKPNHYCSQEEYEWRTWHISNDCTHSIIVMPSGQVLVKHRGNPSGHLLTGDFNCIWHHFNQCLIYVLADKQQDLKRDQWWLLGDDHIFGTNTEEIANFENRRLVYDGMGSELNKEKDLVSNSVLGHTFLGFTAQYDAKYGRIVPVFNIEKALCSALKPGGSVTPALRYARLTGLRILTIFSPGYDLIKCLARRCYESGYVIDEPTDVEAEMVKFLLSWPSDEVIERLWLGFEGSGWVGGLKSEDNSVLKISSELNLQTLLNFVQ